MTQILRDYDYPNISVTIPFFSGTLISCVNLMCQTISVCGTTSIEDLTTTTSVEAVTIQSSGTADFNNVTFTGVIPVISGGTQIVTGTFSISSTGSLSITGVGFQPGLVYIQALPADSTTTYSIGFGYGDSSLNQIATYTNTSAVANSQSVIIYVINTAATTLAQAALTSMDVDGFTLNVTTLSSGPYSFGYIAYL